MQKQRSIKRQVRIAKMSGIDVDEPHRFAKHNATNCSTPNCPMCSNPRHSGFHKQKLTIQELKFNETMDIDYD